jgi:signal transduction histidine kinase
LGLAVARRFVDAHDGRLFVEPNRPHGARFIVELPLR